MMMQKKEEEVDDIDIDGEDQTTDMVDFNAGSKLPRFVFEDVERPATNPLKH